MVNQHEILAEMLDSTGFDSKNPKLIRRNNINKSSSRLHTNWNAPKNYNPENEHEGWAPNDDTSNRRHSDFVISPNTMEQKFQHSPPLGSTLGAGP